MGKGPACLLSAVKSQYQLVYDHNHPTLNPDEVLIQVEAIGLNPIDWKSNVYGFAIYSFPWINGRECAGRIIDKGKDVKSDRLQIDDRVFVASSNYRDIRTSSFQERCVALAENCGRIPDSMTFEEGAGLGVALIAAAAALYNTLGLPRRGPTGVPENERNWILVWASASCAGITLTQLAKVAGLNVIGVCSKQNFDYTKSRGVDIALDREDPEEVIRVAQRYDVKYAVDCVGAETAAYGCRALQSGGQLVALVKGPKEVPDGVTVESILIKKFHEDRAWGEELMHFSETLLASKELIPPRTRIFERGLGGIADGLKLLQNNEISGEKVVVRVRETPQEKKRPAARPPTPLSRPATPTERVKRQKITA